MAELKEIHHYFHSEEYNKYCKHKRIVRFFRAIIYFAISFTIWLIIYQWAKEIQWLELLELTGISLLIGIYLFAIFYLSIHEDLEKYFSPKHYSLKKDYDKYLERFRSHYSLYGEIFRKNKYGYDAHRLANHANLKELFEYSNSLKFY